MQESATQPFQWAKHWYPVAFVDNLDPKVPHPVQLLNQRLVVWCDAQGEWRCFEDKCPHRLAPLSGDESGVSSKVVGLVSLGVSHPVQYISALHASLSLFSRHQHSVFWSPEESHFSIAV
jgi:hypothetical protein